MAYFRAWSNGVLVRDMVPVYTSDSFGFFDRCLSISPKTGTPFYTVSGDQMHTGYKTRLDKIYNSDDYRIVRCIESLSGEDKLNTSLSNFDLVQHFNIEIDYYAPTSESDIPLFGVDNSDGTYMGIGYYPKYNGDNICILFGDNTYILSGAKLGRHKLLINCIEKTIYIDNIEVLSVSDATFSKQAAAYVSMFGLNCSDYNSPKGVKIYGLKLTQSHDVNNQWDFLTKMVLFPVVQKSTGIAGIYMFQGTLGANGFRYMDSNPYGGCKACVK